MIVVFYQAEDGIRDIGVTGVQTFFFSSRRRHTIYWRDWSSDVCSSDLPLARRFAINVLNSVSCSPLKLLVRTDKLR